MTVKVSTYASENKRPVFLLLLQLFPWEKATPTFTIVFCRCWPSLGFCRRAAGWVRVTRMLGHNRREHTAVSEAASPCNRYLGWVHFKSGWLVGQGRRKFFKSDRALPSNQLLRWPPPEKGCNAYLEISKAVLYTSAYRERNTASKLSLYLFSTVFS